MTIAIDDNGTIRPLWPQRGAAQGEPQGEHADSANAPFLALIDGRDCALRLLRLAERDPRARAEEARRRIADLAAAPDDSLHIAIGPENAEGLCWVAWIDRDHMARHIEHFRAAGFEPARMVPAPLLLPAPTPSAGPAIARFSGRVLVRTADFAANIAPDMLPIVLGGAPGGTPDSTTPAASADFTATPVSPALLAEPPLDLLQGPFRPRRRWWREKPFLLQLGALGALVLALAMAPVLVQHQRAANADVLALASAAGAKGANASAAARALATARQAQEDARIGPRLAFVAEAVAAEPGASLRALAFGDGALTITPDGRADAIDRLRQRLLAGPFVAEEEGATILLRGQRPAARPDSSAGRAQPVQQAEARLATARRDAAFLKETGNAAAAGPDAAAVAAQLAAAGIDSHPATADGAADGAANGGAGLTIPRAEAMVLLPLLSRLSADGMKLAMADIARNDDGTLRATLRLGQ